MDYTLLTDEVLIKLLKADDADALKQIYLRHWRDLFLGALRRVRIKEIAEELVQNIFSSLWEKRQSANIVHLESYLKAAIKYQTINYLKSRILNKKHLEYISQTASDQDNGSESLLLIKELSAAIDKAIQQLPEKTQLVFRLSRFEHRSVREISQSMNISEKAVEYHITQSLKIMRVHLKDFILFGLLSFSLPFTGLF